MRFSAFAEPAGRTSCGGSLHCCVVALSICQTPTSLSVLSANWARSASDWIRVRQDQSTYAGERLLPRAAIAGDLVTGNQRLQQRKQIFRRGRGSRCGDIGYQRAVRIFRIGRGIARRLTERRLNNLTVLCRDSDSAACAVVDCYVIRRVGRISCLRIACLQLRLLCLRDRAILRVPLDSGALGDLI